MAIQNGFIQIIQDEKRDYQYEEAMKTLRTNIQFSGNGLKVIMLTSAMPDEGKSETSFQLAISMAQRDACYLSMRISVNPCWYPVSGADSRFTD